MLQQGDGGGERRHHQQGEEHHRQPLAEGQLLEHRRHGHEGEARTRGGIDAGRRQYREDHQARQHRDDARQQHHPEAGAADPLAGGQVGTVGGVDAKADGEGEEGQPHGVQHT